MHLRFTNKSNWIEFMEGDWVFLNYNFSRYRNFSMNKLFEFETVEFFSSFESIKLLFDPTRSQDWTESECEHLLVPNDESQTYEGINRRTLRRSFTSTKVSSVRLNNWCKLIQRISSSLSNALMDNQCEYETKIKYKQVYLLPRTYRMISNFLVF